MPRRVFWEPAVFDCWDVARVYFWPRKRLQHLSYRCRFVTDSKHSQSEFAQILQPFKFEHVGKRSQHTKSQERTLFNRTRQNSVVEFFSGGGGAFMRATNRSTVTLHANTSNRLDSRTLGQLGLSKDRARLKTHKRWKERFFLIRRNRTKRAIFLFQNAGSQLDFFFLKMGQPEYLNVWKVGWYSRHWEHFAQFAQTSNSPTLCLIIPTSNKLITLTNTTKHLTIGG